MKNSIFLILLAMNINAYGQSVILGPDAPDVEVSFENNEFKFDWNNPSMSNNYNLNYLEFDPSISGADPYWRFQGYILYQSINDQVDIYEFLDPDLVRIVKIVDIADTINFINAIKGNALGDCFDHSLALPNVGLDDPFYAGIDPFTGAPYIENEEYCFKVFAFASNPFHVDSTCQAIDQLVIGYSGAIGDVQQHCISADPTGLQEYETLSIDDPYPNPFFDSFNLNFFEVHDNVEVNIFNTHGSLILTQNYNVTDLAKVSFEGSKGIYFVEIRSQNKKAYFKMIKN